MFGRNDKNMSRIVWQNCYFGMEMFGNLVFSIEEWKSCLQFLLVELQYKMYNDNDLLLTSFSIVGKKTCVISCLSWFISHNKQ